MTDAIRPARASDAAAVRRVARRAWHAAYDDVLGPAAVDETVDDWYADDALARDARREDRPFFVHAADRVAGFVVGLPDEDDPTLAHCYRLYVDPDRWGEGIGTALLDRLADRFAATGFDRLELSVLATNRRAVGFYESRGFDRVGRAPDEATDADRLTYRQPL